MKIFVGCASSDYISEKYRVDCKVLLNELFKDNDLVFGAYDSGLMGDCYNIALKQNKNIIGICTDEYKDDLKNLNCTNQIITKNINGRIDKLIGESDILLFLPGGIGTINELFSSIDSKRCHEHNKPIIIYNSENYYDELLIFLDKLYKEKFSESEVSDTYFISNDKEAIISYINNIK